MQMLRKVFLLLSFFANYQSLAIDNIKIKIDGYLIHNDKYVGNENRGAYEYWYICNYDMDITLYYEIIKHERSLQKLRIQLGYRKKTQKIIDLFKDCLLDNGFVKKENKHRRIYIHESLLNDPDINYLEEIFPQNWDFMQIFCPTNNEGFSHIFYFWVEQGIISTTVINSIEESLRAPKLPIHIRHSRVVDVLNSLFLYFDFKNGDDYQKLLSDIKDLKLYEARSVILQLFNQIELIKISGEKAELILNLTEYFFLKEIEKSPKFNGIIKKAQFEQIEALYNSVYDPLVHGSNHEDYFVKKYEEVLRGYHALEDHENFQKKAIIFINNGKTDYKSDYSFITSQFSLDSFQAIFLLISEIRKMKKYY